MSHLIDQLLRDHDSLKKILAALEDQMQLIEHDQKPDDDLLVEIMDYMRNYMDIFHHPREDLIFQRLLERHNGDNSVIEALLHEHEQLSAASSNLSDEIDGVFLAEQPRPRENLAILARDFADSNHRHMEQEERKVFPLAREVLDVEDWTLITASLPDEKLPSFEQLLKQQYRTLERHIRSAVSG
jgi:hemerythrin-like domain-containing protein